MARDKNEAINSYITDMLALEDHIEKAVRGQLEDLKDYPDVEVVGSADNGLHGVEIIERVEPDVVFLDVQMPGLDGIGVIRKLREHTDELPYFVLVTAYDNYAIEAFRMEALDYLFGPEVGVFGKCSGRGDQSGSRKR